MSRPKKSLVRPSLPGTVHVHIVSPVITLMTQTLDVQRRSECEVHSLKLLVRLKAGVSHRPPLKLDSLSRRLISLSTAAASMTNHLCNTPSQHHWHWLTHTHPHTSIKTQHIHTHTHMLSKKYAIWSVLPVWLENWTELMESTSNPKTWRQETDWVSGEIRSNSHAC